MFLSTQDYFLGYFFALDEHLANLCKQKARKINTYELIFMIWGKINPSKSIKEATLGFNCLEWLFCVTISFDNFI